MRCKKARILLSVCLDGELTRHEELALERHLSACADCAQERAKLATLSEAMSLWPDEEPSQWLAESFAHKLREPLEQVEPVRLRRPRWVFSTAGAGLVTALLVLGFLLHSQFQPPVPEGPTTPPVVAPGPDQTGPAPGPPNIGPEPAPGPEVVGPTEPVEPIGPPPPGPMGPTYTRPTHPGTLTSRTGVHRRETERVILSTIVAAKASEGEATDTVTDNLGEAGLAMNETIERVRGTLRRAADLMVSECPMPVEDDTYSDGGEIE